MAMARARVLVCLDGSAYLFEELLRSLNFHLCCCDPCCAIQPVHAFLILHCIFGCPSFFFLFFSWEGSLWCTSFVGFVSKVLLNGTVWYRRSLALKAASLQGVTVFFQTDFGIT